jgi:hypothetical protein
VGSGAVAWSDFFQAARSCPAEALVIEREAGGTREEDIITAKQCVITHGMC